MKKLFALLVTLLMTCSVSAADNYWSGPYVGMQIGGELGKIKHSIPNYGDVPGGDASGVSVGPSVGYNKSVGTLMLGGEIGVNWDNVKGSNTVSSPEKLRTEQSGDASAVFRLGVPIQRMMYYGLIGIGITKINSNYENSGPPSPKGSDTVTGWILGAGVESAVTNRLHVRVQYRYTGYGEADVACATCGPTFVTLTTHSLTAGLSMNW